MNISIQQYRMSIGRHNNVRFRKMGFLPPGNSINSIYDSLNELSTSAAICLYYILFITFVINYLLDIFQEYISNTHPTTPVIDSNKTVAYTSNINSMAVEYRILIGCFSYCIIYVILGCLKMLSTSSFKSIFKVIYFRLFHRKSFCEYCANIYSIWIFLFNFILIALLHLHYQILQILGQ